MTIFSFTAQARTRQPTPVLPRGNPRFALDGYPDTMPRAIELTDSEGRSYINVPITQDGKVVNSQGYMIDIEDD
jgi:hypothetical protein